MEDADTEKRSTRPTTARRRPPKVKDGAKEVQAKDIAPAVAKKTTGIIIDGQNDDVSHAVCRLCCIILLSLLLVFVVH